MCQHGDGNRRRAGDNEVDQRSRYQQYVASVAKMLLHFEALLSRLSLLSHASLVRAPEEAVSLLNFGGKLPNLGRSKEIFARHKRRNRQLHNREEGRRDVS